MPMPTSKRPPSVSQRRSRPVNGSVLAFVAVVAVGSLLVFVGSFALEGVSLAVLEVCVGAVSCFGVGVVSVFGAGVVSVLEPASFPFSAPAWSGCSRSSVPPPSPWRPARSAPERAGERAARARFGAGASRRGRSVPRLPSLAHYRPSSHFACCCLPHPVVRLGPSSSGPSFPLRACQSLGFAAIASVYPRNFLLKDRFSCMCSANTVLANTNILSTAADGCAGLRRFGPPHARVGQAIYAMTHLGRMVPIGSAAQVCALMRPA